MNAESLLLQALNITAIGMSVVFVFLIILVIMMKALGKAVEVLEVYFPQTVPGTESDHSLIAVAIAAAKRFQGK